MMGAWEPSNVLGGVGECGHWPKDATCDPSVRRRLWARRERLIFPASYPLWPTYTLWPRAHN